MDKIFYTDEFKDVINETMLFFKDKPLACTQMSCLLLGELEKFFENYDWNIKTGNVFYNNDSLFKQDFSLNEISKNINKSWGGHCWIEMNNKYVWK